MEIWNIGASTVVITLGLFTRWCAIARVVKPPADYRLYRTYKLKNGITALGVRDDRATLDGYGIGVGSGSLRDPIDVPGMAHFVEHTLLLGSKSYPSTGSYEQFLSSRGGSNNAFTNDDTTVFFNQIEPSSLKEGMERLADLLINPTFDEQAAINEARAIDAEHEKNVPNDDERVMRVLRSYASRPLSNFGTGNFESLTKHSRQPGDISKRLRMFHRQNYCGSNLVLVTISKRSLNYQEALANKIFSSVAVCKDGNPSLNKRPIAGNPFDKLPQVNTFRVLANGSPALWLIWHLPSLQSAYKKLPLRYLTYLLGFAGPGSLRSKLRDENLIFDIEIVEERNAIATFFGLKILLTKKGVAQYSSVVDHVQSFITILQDRGVDETILKGLQKMSEAQFSTLQPGSSVMDEAAKLCEALILYDSKDVLRGDVLMFDMDPAFVGHVLTREIPSARLFVFIVESPLRNSSNSPVMKE